MKKRTYSFRSQDYLTWMVNLTNNTFRNFSLNNKMSFESLHETLSSVVIIIIASDKGIRKGEWVWG